MAPPTAPTDAAADRDRLSRKSENPLRKKAVTAETFCIRMPMRLVPLATGAGMSMNSITGTVSRDPPPAMTLSQPAMTPTPASRMSCG